MTLLDAAKRVLAALDGNEPLMGPVDQLRAEVAKAEKPAKVGSAHFDAFWAAYPRRIDKAGCLRKWMANGLDKVGPQILAHVKAKASTHDWQKENFRFVPMPATYLNQRRWEEQVGTAVDDSWWQRAGFSSRYEAENAGCKPHNAYAYQNGERLIYDSQTVGA